MNEAIAIINHSTLVRARRRVQIALCILEDGYYDLLTSNDVAGLLASAISDLEDAQKVERDATPQAAGLNWNDYTALTESEAP
jgi:hypothetical protein